MGVVLFLFHIQVNFDVK